MQSNTRGRRDLQKNVGSTSTPAAASSVNIKSAPKSNPKPIQPKVTATTTTPPTVVVDRDDPLQLAAQAYPWLYMTSTLEACFKSSQKNAQRDLDARVNELDEQEKEVEEEKKRQDVESALDVYEGLLGVGDDDDDDDDNFSKQVPHIMQTFILHGEACSRVSAEALELANKAIEYTPKQNHVDSDDDEDAENREEEEEDYDAPMRIYNEMLDNLESLQNEAADLESSILRIASSLGGGGGDGADDEGLGVPPPPITTPAVTATTESDHTNPPPPPSSTSPPDDSSSSSPHAQLVSVFLACLPVIRARIANLSMAQELVDSAQENVSISLRMESLGL